MRVSQFRFNVRDENEMNFFLLGYYLLISNKPQFPEQNSVKVIRIQNKLYLFDLYHIDTINDKELLISLLQTTIIIRLIGMLKIEMKDEQYAHPISLCI